MGNTIKSKFYLNETSHLSLGESLSISLVVDTEKTESLYLNKVDVEPLSDLTKWIDSIDKMRRGKELETLLAPALEKFGIEEIRKLILQVP